MEAPRVSSNLQPLSLGELKVGESARVLAVGGTRAVARRLLEMGLTDGTMVRILRLAPLGDPIELFLRGYHLTLRRDEARTVKVARE